MTRTLPRSTVLAASVDPKTRDYIAAVLAEEFVEIRRLVAQLNEQVAHLTNSRNGWAGNLTARMNTIQAQIAALPTTRSALHTLLSETTATAAEAAVSEAESLRQARLRALAEAPASRAAPAKGAGKP